MRRAFVIGSGLAGLAGALHLRAAGADVTLATMGLGGLQLSAGTIDVLGYAPDRVERPLEAISALDASHPLALLGAQTVEEAVTWITEKLGSDYLEGRADRNVVLSSAVGALRPTALYQPSMAAGRIEADVEYTICGIRQYKDFYPDLIAGNLARQGVSATPSWIDFAARPGEADSTAVTFARVLDTDEGVARLASALGTVPGNGPIGLPAILGLKTLGVYRTIGRILGREVFEIPGLPPSVPGMRLNEALRAACTRAGVRLIQGARVVGFEASDSRVTSVRTHAAGRDVTYEVDAVLHAPGGFESGGLAMDSHGHVIEPLFSLPLSLPEGPLVHGDYWGHEQPVFNAGVRVDAAMRPINEDGTPVFDNLALAGQILPGSSGWNDKSGEGVALASALVAARTLTEEEAK